jgi:peptide/nickel transport system substrate-binding protein
MAQQCEVPIHPSSWLYETQSAVYYYSPERAMQYLYDSGWTDMTGDTMLNKVEDNVLLYVDVNILVYNEASSKVRSNAAEQIAENLRAVGINATVTVAESRRDVRKAMEDGKFDVALVSMNLSEVPDLIPLFSEGGKLNYSKVGNETLNQMLRECAAAKDEQSMKLAYGNIQEYIVNNLPVMGVCFRTGMVLSGRSMAGMTISRETDAYSGIEFLADDWR